MIVPKFNFKFSELTKPKYKQICLATSKYVHKVKDECNATWLNIEVLMIPVITLLLINAVNLNASKGLSNSASRSAKRNTAGLWKLTAYGNTTGLPAHHNSRTIIPTASIGTPAKSILTSALVRVLLWSISWALPVTRCCQQWLMLDSCCLIPTLRLLLPAHVSNSPH